MTTLNSEVLAAATNAFVNGEAFNDMRDDRIRVVSYPHNGVWNVDLYLFQPNSSTMLLSTTSSSKGAELDGFTLMVPSTCCYIHSQVLNSCLDGYMEFVVVDKNIFAKKAQKRRQITPLTKRTSTDLAEYWQK